MDSRTIVATIAFVGALVAGVGLGWWHGPSLAPGTEVVAPVAIASPLESAAGGGGDASSSSLPPSSESGPPPSPMPTPYDGEVFAIGDSVLAGAASCLDGRGISVNAKQSRRVSDAVEILERQRDRLPERVIVHLGTNGGATTAELDAILTILGPDRIVMWSTIQLPDDPTRYTYERATNDAIARLVDSYDNVRIFDWESVSKLHPDWLYAEGIHMTPEGCRGYANLVEPQIRAP